MANGDAGYVGGLLETSPETLKFIGRSRGLAANPGEVIHSADVGGRVDRQIRKWRWCETPARDLLPDVDWLPGGAAWSRQVPRRPLAGAKNCQAWTLTLVPRLIPGGFERSTPDIDFSRFAVGGPKRHRTLGPAIKMGRPSFTGTALSRQRRLASIFKGTTPSSRFSSRHRHQSFSSPQGLRTSGVTPSSRGRLALRATGRIFR